MNAWDPSGHDAIWLQQTDGAAGFGHTAIVAQYNQKRWMYFSFASSNIKNIFLNIVGTIGSIEYKKYDLEAGMSKEEATKAVGSIASSLDHWDYGINCMQLVSRALWKGDWADYRNKMLKKKLREAEKDPIPNSMYVKIAKFVNFNIAVEFFPAPYILKRNDFDLCR